jgi:hypothetical protein
MARRPIDVILTADGGGIDPSVVNPLRDVLRGDVVVWSFPEGQELQVVLPNSSLFDSAILQCERGLNQISRRVAANVPGGARFDYHIMRGQDRLKFGDQITGTIIIRDPPF